MEAVAWDGHVCPSSLLVPKLRLGTPIPEALLRRVPNDGGIRVAPAVFSGAVPTREFTPPA